MHVSNPYLPSLGRQRLSHLISPFCSANWKRLLATYTLCRHLFGEAGIANSCSWCLLCHYELVVLHLYTSVSSINTQSFLLHNTDKQSDGHLMYAQIIKQMSVDGFVWWRGLFEYFLHIGRTKKRQCLRQLLSETGKQTWLWKGLHSEDFCKPLALYETQFLLKSLVILPKHRLNRTNKFQLYLQKVQALISELDLF